MDQNLKLRLSKTADVKHQMQGEACLPSPFHSPLPVKALVRPVQNLGFVVFPAVRRGKWNAFTL